MRKTFILTMLMLFGFIAFSQNSGPSSIPQSPWNVNAGDYINHIDVTAGLENYTGNNANIANFVLGAFDKQGNVRGCHEAKALSVGGNTYYYFPLSIGYRDNEEGNLDITLAFYDKNNPGTYFGIIETSFTIGQDYGSSPMEPYYVDVAEVASIGNYNYSTLQGAIEAATEGQTVVLLENVTLTDALTVAADKGFTLDLNGKTISGTSSEGKSFALITNNGNLKIKDNSSEKTGKITYTYTGEAGGFAWGNYTIANRGTLTVESGTIENATAAMSGHMFDAIDNYSGATATINGGTVSCPNYIGIRLFATSETVNNTVIINGGTVSAKFALWPQNSSDGTKDLLATLELNDGTINGTSMPLYIDHLTPKMNITKDDGVEIPAPEGYAWNAEGKLIKAVAKFDGKIYATLREAIDAIPDNYTGNGTKMYHVYLLDDAAGPGVVINKNTVQVTIDLGGHTYTFTEGVGSANTKTNGFQILSKKFVLIKNGTLKVADEAASKFGMLIQNYANLTINKVVLDGTNLDRTTYSYVLSNNSGNVNVNGASKIIANDSGDAYAFDAYDYSAYGYSLPKVTITDDVEITGKIDAVAKSGNTYYASFAQAYENAQAGATLTLLKDITAPGTVINKNITIDLGGKTYTFNEGVGSTGTESNGFQILQGNAADKNNVTIKNGILNVADEAASKFGMLIQNYANLTVTDVVMDGENLDKASYSYVLSNNSGTVNVNGNTVINANTNPEGFAFDACKYGNYTEPVVTVAETVTVNGKIEAAAKIGNVYYATFDQAYGAAEAGETITLLATVELTTDKTLNLTKAITVGADVNPAFRIKNGAKITVENANIDTEAGEAADGYNFILGASDGSSAGNLIIKGGNFRGATTVASVTKGTLTIEGGVFSVEPYEGSHEYLLNCIDANYKNGTAKIEVKGGKFYEFNPENNAAEGAGTNFCATNYASVQGQDNSGTYYEVVSAIVKITDSNNEDTYYPSLEAALAAAQDGDKITLLTDVEISSTLMVSFNSAFDKINVTIDGNGKTIKAVGNSWNDNQWMVDIAWNVTLDNITFDANNTGCKGVQFYTSNSTLNNVTVKNVSADKLGTTDYAIHSNASKLTVTGNLTFEGCKYGHLVMDMGSSLPEQYNTTELNAENATASGVTVTVANNRNNIVVSDSFTIAGAVAKIGNTYYMTFDAAYAAPNAGENKTIDLLEPVTVASGEKEYDLSGITVQSEGDAFIATNGAKLTLEGDGVIKGGTTGKGSWTAVWANGGDVTINGGTYSVGGDSDVAATAPTHQNDVIYTKNGGTVTINGGTFLNDGTVWTLNKKDASAGTEAGGAITVYGGTFQNWNPACNVSEGANTNFVAEGYEIVKDGNNYIVADVIATNENSYCEKTVAGGQEPTVTFNMSGNIPYVTNPANYGGVSGHWAGFKLTAPAGFKADKIKITRPDGQTRFLNNVMDGEENGNVFAHFYFDASKPANESLKYYIDWTNDGTDDLTVLFVNNATLEPVAKIGETPYATIQAAVNAATAGQTVEVIKNANLTEAVVLDAEKSIKIDLSDITLTSTGDVFEVNSGTLTLEGNGVIKGGTTGKGSWTAVWANGGNVIINGGTYSVGGDSDVAATAPTHQNDVIYTKNGGTVTINGGTFLNDGTVWTLNRNDQTGGAITVKGGTFYNWNPADNVSEGEPTNFLADDYKVNESTDGQGNDIYEVVGALISIDGKFYADFNDALAYLKDNVAHNITLYKKIEAADKDVIFYTWKNSIASTEITIDLNGNEFSLKSVTAKSGMRVNIKGEGGKFVLAGTIRGEAGNTINIGEGVVFDGTIQMNNTKTNPGTVLLAEEKLIGTDGVFSIDQSSTSYLSIGVAYPAKNINLGVGHLILNENYIIEENQTLTIGAGGNIVVPAEITLTLANNAEIKFLSNVYGTGNITGAGTVVVNNSEQFSAVLGTDIQNIKLAASVEGEVVVDHNLTIDLYGKNIVGDVTVNEGGVLTIIDSTVDGTNYKEAGYVNGDLTVNENAKLAIAAGTYNQDVIDYCKDFGFASALNANETYTVMPGALTVDDVAYATWTEANSDIADGAELIKLFGDVTDEKVGEIYVAGGKNINLDLNGHNLTIGTTITLNSGSTFNVVNNGEDASFTMKKPKSVVLKNEDHFRLATNIEFIGTVQIQNVAVGNKNYFHIGDELVIGKDGLFEAQTDHAYATIHLKAGVMELELESGHLMLMKDLATLKDQKITVWSNAVMSINEGATLTLDPETTVVINGTVGGEGTIAVNSLTHLVQVLGTEIENVQIANENGIEIAEELALDLTGKTVTSAGDVFVVTAGGNLTLNGAGEVKGGTSGVGSWTAVWANGGNVTINGGTYSVGGDSNSSSQTHQNDVIYTKNDGTVTINGGTFLNEGNVWTLNENDENRETIAVTGGTFYNWNPADNVSEGVGTNFCAAGFGAIETSENVWEVKPAQSYSLHEGWNWFSSYIDINGTTGLTKLQTALANNASQIKGQNGSATFESVNGYDLWFGVLQETGLSNTEMYMIKMNSANSIELVGDKVDLLKTNIKLEAGSWSWIPYLLDVEMSVEDVFSGIASDGDHIKNHSGYSEYSEIQGFGGFWWGTFSTMEPGQGYIYNSTTGATLNYSQVNTGSAKGELKANVTAENNHYRVNAYQYPNNMTVTAVLNVNGELMGEGYEVAAFVNGECRGSVRPIYVEPLDTYMFFLTIHGDDVEEVTLKYIDLATSEEYILNERFNYSNDAALGRIAEPYVLSYGTMNIDDMSANTVTIYPNPTTTNTEISLQSTCDVVEVFNALGVKIAEYQNVDAIDAFETAGIYVIRITNDNNVQHCRLIVK